MKNLNEVSSLVCHRGGCIGKHRFVLAIRYREILHISPTRSASRKKIPFVYPEVECIRTDVSGNVPDPLNEDKSPRISQAVFKQLHNLEYYGGGDVDATI